MAGTLFIVSIHIGNIEDLTFRAKRIISECDILICEELKPARSLLKELHLFKEIIPLNEHTEKEASLLLVKELLSGKNCCLISDTGTPVFSDPGQYLIKLAKENDIQTTIIPGPDSLVPALVGSGFDISRFYYAGWLSPKTETRRNELKKLKAINQAIVIMETPYRLKQLLADINEVFGSELKICLACDLTTPNEKFIRGKVNDIYKVAIDTNLKCEFVLIIDNNKTGSCLSSR